MLFQLLFARLKVGDIFFSFLLSDFLSGTIFSTSMSRKGPLIGLEAEGVACRGILDFVEDCGLGVRTH